jgi:hypothetical protein
VSDGWSATRATRLRYHEHRTLNDALGDARTFARSFGEPLIHVHERDGFCHTVEVEPEFRAPTPADVKGPRVEP